VELANLGVRLAAMTDARPGRPGWTGPPTGPRRSGRACRRRSEFDRSRNPLLGSSPFATYAASGAGARLSRGLARDDRRLDSWRQTRPRWSKRRRSARQNWPVSPGRCVGLAEETGSQQAPPQTEP